MNTYNTNDLNELKTVAMVSMYNGNTLEFERDLKRKSSNCLEIKRNGEIFYLIDFQYRDSNTGMFRKYAKLYKKVIRNYENKDFIEFLDVSDMFFNSKYYKSNNVGHAISNSGYGYSFQSYIIDDLDKYINFNY